MIVIMGNMVVMGSMENTAMESMAGIRQMKSKSKSIKKKKEKTEKKADVQEEFRDKELEASLAKDYESYSNHREYES